MRRIEAAAVRAGRDASGIVLVAVTKGFEAGLGAQAIEGGARHIGENRVQEALLKFAPLNRVAAASRVALTWHLIGHLQTNKVKDAVRIFDLIHSVDSVRLATAIDREALKIRKVQDILLEVNVSRETTKYGLALTEAGTVAREISSLGNVRLKGLMTVAPFVDDAQEARPYFRRLRELGEEIFRLKPDSPGSPFLSMGMTNDFEVAVEEGATHVRIGRGIFGERS